MTVFRNRQTRRRALLATVAVLAWSLPQQGANAGEVADTLRQLSREMLVSERISLRELGIRENISLASADARREIYLPVPANVPLHNSTLSLKGHYLRGDGGRTTFLLSLDGNAVSARSFTEDQGDAGISVGIDGAPRESGFVRMGMAWSSSVGQNFCEDARLIGNVMEILPDTYIDYQYDASQVHDLYTAWTALPQKVVIATSGGVLDKDSYDAAWRLGVTLERAGKRVEIRALPTIGDTVDISGIVVPEGLRSIPAFGAISVGGKRTIANAAEAGALFLLGQGGGKAHFLIADGAMSSAVNRAIEALGEQLVAADPDARSALAELQGSKASISRAGGSEKTVRLETLGGRPLIVVDAKAGAAAAGLFDELWRSSARSERLQLNTVRLPGNESDNLSLSVFGNAAGSLDVVSRADWGVNFDLSAGIADGKVPGYLDVDVSAAPGATETSPVASVFLNDYLLGAKRLEANGRPERIAAPIPFYALQPRNSLRVQFQRQPSSDNCRETPQPFPAAVLPSSRIRLEAAPSPREFIGLIPRLTGKASVYIPDSWRSRSSETLSTVIRVAAAGGISPIEATFQTAQQGAALAPDTSFIAFDVPVEQVSQPVEVSGERVILKGSSGEVIYDVDGQDRIAAVNVAESHGHAGLVYQTIGSRTLQTNEPFRLSRGNVALLGSAGVLAVTGVSSAAQEAGSEDSGNGFLSAKWRESLPAVLPALVIGAFLIVLGLAWRVRARKRKSSGNH